MMDLVYDYPRFPFPGHWAGLGSVCAVRVYANAEGSSAVVLVIETDENDGTSITNAFERIMTALEQQVLRGLLARDAAVRWVEIYANTMHPLPTFDWVERAEVSLEHPGGVRWRVGRRAEVEAAIGRPVTGLPDGDEREAVETR